jgi:hypothetical protein
VSLPLGANHNNVSHNGIIGKGTVQGSFIRTKSDSKVHETLQHTTTTMTSGSARDFRTNSLDRLNNTYRPSAELDQDHLRINSQSYDNNRFLLYSFNNNSLNIYHQNIRGLQGKTNELTSSLYPELPQFLYLTEHHLVNPELDDTHIQHYNLGA